MLDRFPLLAHCLRQMLTVSLARRGTPGRVVQLGRGVVKDRYLGMRDGWTITYVMRAGKMASRFARREFSTTPRLIALSDAGVPLLAIPCDITISDAAQGGETVTCVTCAHLRSPWC